MNEKIRAILNNPKRAHVAVGVAAFAGGAVVGYFLGRRSGGYGIHEIPVQEAFNYDQLDEFLDNNEVSESKALVVDAEMMEEIRQRSVSAGETFVSDIIEQFPTEPEPEVEEPVRQSIFAHDDDDWNYEEEVKTRTPDEPYVIHKDEFYNDERGFTQTTLSYYAGDDILVDEEDRPIYNHKQVVGEMKFGHGSGDPNVFHVRNEKLRAEYEILHNVGQYSVEVLGLEIENNERAREIKHSEPRFRRED